MYAIGLRKSASYWWMVNGFGMCVWMYIDSGTFYIDFFIMNYKFWFKTVYENWGKCIFLIFNKKKKREINRAWETSDGSSVYR